MRAMPAVCLADGCLTNELLPRLGLIRVPVLEGGVRFRATRSSSINKSLRWRNGRILIYYQPGDL